MQERSFAHRSEEEFARILDFYGIRWEYEPRTFALDVADDGSRIGFTPDFHLPDLGLWVELTTLRRALMRQKRRKIRAFSERYPELRVKLLGSDDLRALMVKYGGFGAASLGPRGCNTPPRRRAARRAARTGANRAAA